MEDFYCEDAELKNILSSSLDMHNIRERVVAVCELCAQRYPGDFVEIGGKRGETTVFLAEIARKYSRKVIVVDPWVLNTEDCHEGDYEEFMRIMTPYADITEIIRASSLDEKTISILKEKEISFAFIDGMHYGYAILSDIKSFVNINGIIAVDDINHIWRDAMSGFIEGAKAIGRTPIHNPIHREGYII